MDLNQWARKWNLSTEALRELVEIWCAHDTDPNTFNCDGMSETAVTSRGRLEESKRGTRLWRNNSGALKDERGRLVRYGLCNDSAQANKIMKSADFIGIRPTLITVDMIGWTIGQFVAREYKEGSWKYTGKEREVAQKTFIDTINALGGDACFWNGSRYEP